MRDAGNSESHPWSHHPERDEREAGSGEQGGEIFGEIRTSLQISDPVMAKPWAQLLDRGISRVSTKPVFGFSDMVGHKQKMARGLIFRI